MKAGACDFEEDGEKGAAGNKKPNGLPIWGNEKTMNLNPLILTNIQSSQYFKEKLDIIAKVEAVNLYQLKTYHEVIDEIYYNVTHLEPWEKGSRKTSGQTGMCGGVRGVGAGGIVSTAFCILYKLYTLRLTRKQVVGLLNHADSPYIRGLGFMFTQPPADLWDWLEPYLDDEEEIDVRAGGGQTTTIGHTVRHMLSKLEWYSTLFPRIPVPIQKELEKKLAEHAAAKAAANPTVASPAKKDWYGGRPEAEAAPQKEHGRSRGSSQEYNCRDERVRDTDRERERVRDRDGTRSQDQERDWQGDRTRERNGDYDRGRNRHRDRERDRGQTDRERDRERDRDRERERDRGDRERERDRDRHRHRERDHSHDRKHRRRDRYSYPDDRGDFAELLEREKHRIKKERKRDGSRERSRRSRSPDKDRRRHH